jgi:membrane protein DedA with SNARE-associated domain
MAQLLYSFLSYPHYLIYAGIFLLMIFLGEELLLIVGALARFGFIDFWDSVFFAILGTFFGDMFWYQLGKRYGENFVIKYGRFFFMTPARFKNLKTFIMRKSGLFIFVSKFMYNLNHISLVAAGAIKFNFKKFLKFQIFVSMGWVLAFVSLGFFFANNLAVLRHDVTVFTIVVVLVFAGFILLEKILEKFIKSKVFDKENGSSHGSE